MTGVDDYIRRLLTLGYDGHSANYLVTKHVQRGTLDELETELVRLERERRG